MATSFQDRDKGQCCDLIALDFYGANRDAQATQPEMISDKSKHYDRGVPNYELDGGKMPLRDERY